MATDTPRVHWPALVLGLALVACGAPGSTATAAPPPVESSPVDQRAEPPGESAVSPADPVASAPVGDGTDPEIDAEISPDGRTEARVGSGFVELRDVASHEVRWRAELPQGPVGVGFASDGTRVGVLIGGDPVRLRVLEVSTGRLLVAALVAVPWIPSPRWSRAGTLGLQVRSITGTVGGHEFQIENGELGFPIVVNDPGDEAREGSATIATGTRLPRAPSSPVPLAERGRPPASGGEAARRH